MTDAPALPAAFLALSARLGQDPLQVQGPGGNTSCKLGEAMWIKASGTLLADAERLPIFMAVDRALARAEALGAGDGTCMASRLDPGNGLADNRLRPSIETTFHALIDWPVVVHTHSVAALVHAICPEGRRAAAGKLAGLDPVAVPYAKPGLPLTREIAARSPPGARLWLLENHGLICAGADVASVATLLDEVERRLRLPPVDDAGPPPGAAPPGRVWLAGSGALARDARLCRMLSAGSYYPDHVVFLGPAVPLFGPGCAAPLALLPGEGLAMRTDATPAQWAMAAAIRDVLARLPAGWEPEALTPDDEAALLDWDAEKYRQALAARQAAPDKRGE
jgi:rhamnose utilization protein RhaD (predicted bifunctional aldolase and dehydrogenase)